MSTTLGMYADRLESLRERDGLATTERALTLGAQALRIFAALESFAGDDAVTVGRNASGRYYARLTGRQACAGETLTDALGQLAQILAFEEEERDTIPAPPPLAAEATP